MMATAAALPLITPAAAKSKPREELNSEIEARIKKHGVQTFTLDIVPKGEAATSWPDRCR